MGSMEHKMRRQRDRAKYGSAGARMISALRLREQGCTCDPAITVAGNGHDVSVEHAPGCLLARRM
jgi:hypothetical protein